MGLGLSQEAMALEAGIDRTYASQIERGVSNPSLRVICAVAEILGVEAVDLLSDQEKCQKIFCGEEVEGHAKHRAITHHVTSQVCCKGS